VNCLDETTISGDTTLYLSRYYLVNNLVHLPNPHISVPLKNQEKKVILVQ